jgi:hypothetical protein
MDSESENGSSEEGAGNHGLEAIHALRSHYRSGRASIGSEFFAPCLRSARLYRRAAGYFSSSALITWAAALPRLARSGDLSIKVIASPQLVAQDIEILKSISDPQQRHQYESILVDRIIDDIIKLAEEPNDRQLRARIFAWLIANTRLTIRFAFPNHVEDSGLFHEKIGIFDFPEGDQVRLRLQERPDKRAQNALLHL